MCIIEICLRVLRRYEDSNKEQYNYTVEADWYTAMTGWEYPKDCRQMASYEDKKYSISCQYNVSGLRTKKEVKEKATRVITTTEYRWEESSLIAQKISTADTSGKTSEETIWFVYEGERNLTFLDK